MLPPHTCVIMIRPLLLTFLGFILVFIVPVALRAALFRHEAGAAWRNADRSSARLLPPDSAAALVRIYSARTVSWRGIVAVHSWIVIKDRDGPYERYDLTAWGEPIRLNGFLPDGRWFGQVPEEVYAADGAAAEPLVRRMREAIRSYRYARLGEYTAWPGPNSNTFVAAVMAAVPEIRASLPPTAIGKDFPVDGRWLAATPSRTGFRLSLGGYAGFTIAWVEGLQINVLGLVAGVDLRRPAIFLPAFGRL
jgi:hypothetical protein